MMRFSPCEDPNGCSTSKRSSPSTRFPRRARWKTAELPIPPTPSTMASNRLSSSTVRRLYPNPANLRRAERLGVHPLPRPAGCVTLGRPIDLLPSMLARRAPNRTRAERERRLPSQAARIGEWPLEQTPPVRLRACPSGMHSPVRWLSGGSVYVPLPDGARFVLADLAMDEGRIVEVTAPGRAGDDV